MLSALSFLIHGKNIEKQEHNLKELEILYSINKNRPVRDANGNRFTSDELTEDLSKRITTLNLEAFRPVVFGVFEKLAEQDDALHYFVLVSTYRLTDEKFRESLEDLTLKQKLMTKIDGEFRYRLYSKPIEQNNIPQLAWDITPVLQNREVTEKDSPVSSNGHSIIKPVDEWGLISQEFRSILNCEELIQSAREGQSIEFFHLDQITFYKNLLDMHRGVSSDLFQLDSDNHFYQSKPCRVEEWNLTTTRTVHQKHIFLANQLSEVVRHLKDDFVFETSNSMRLLIQKYLIDEQYIFSDYFDSLLECSTNLQYRTIVETLPSLNLQSTSNRFEVCDEIFEIVSAHYHVIREMNEIVRRINDYSPIILNEISFIGSQSAPQFYSRQMWRRMNVSLIHSIVNKLAEMLTTPDAELMELLTDAGDAKMIKDPSIWQRLNPLTMESSQCIDEGLANRVADLIIGYQFFIKDKKNKSQKSDESTFGISDIQDAEELELFAKTCNFEKIIDDILSDVDMSSTDGNLDELSTCINKLLEQVPTKTIVEKYSQIVLEKSVRFFEFLKTFFTSAYIHLKSKNILSQATLDMLEREKMHKKGYDSEFLKTVGYDMKSTMEDSLLTVNPPEPLNVFVTTGVTDIYSQVFTVLNMLHTALDAVIETKNSETLKHEPRLRYAFFHMNTTVFAIRKNMLSLIEASYETFMKTLDFKKPSVNRSSHQLLNVCYRAHRKFIRDVAGALMLTSKRGTTGRVIRLMVSSVTQASKACLSGDAVGADRYYQQFQTNLLIFLDQCRLDHTRYPLYRSLEIGSDEADGRRSLNSSYSDDLSCRSY
uniref:DH domain-containing protein n=1 Tax=Caenorhabditis tropicalis TaxID=1561998 RepID=A0A1I7UHN6_9PELO